MDAEAVIGLAPTTRQGAQYLPAALVGKINALAKGRSSRKESAVSSSTEALAAGEAPAQQELSPFVKRAHVFQSLANASDAFKTDVATFSQIVQSLADELEEHDIDFETFAQSAIVLADELKKHGITLDDVREVLK